MWEYYLHVFSPLNNWSVSNVVAGKILIIDHGMNDKEKKITNREQEKTNFFFLLLVNLILKLFVTPFLSCAVHFDFDLTLAFFIPLLVFYFAIFCFDLFVFDGFVREKDRYTIERLRLIFV